LSAPPLQAERRDDMVGSFNRVDLFFLAANFNWKF
jgi:hypothetical protein